jgi:hypothetical protein
VVEAPVVFGATQSFTTPDPGPPPIKRFPKVFFNGVKAQGMQTPHPDIAVGVITLHNSQLGTLQCHNAVAGVVYNEFTEGTEKGFQNSTGYTTYACTSGAECRVKNTKGEEVEGNYLTAEAPPVATGTEAHETGISSLPWIGELIERETGKRQVLTKHVKLWYVSPPEPPGKGAGCLGVDFPFEDQEGPSEKERGFELAPIWVNGSKNGLKPSHGEFIDETGVTEKGFPVTGRLNSIVGPGDLTATTLTIGGLGGAWELMTVE